MKKSILSPSIQTISTPLILFIVMVILYGMMIKIGLSQIGGQREALVLGRKNVNVLEQKLNLLQEVEENILTYADASLGAVPDKNPSLLAMSQLKEEAAINSVQLENLRSGQSSTDKIGLPRVILTFDALGNVSDVTNFLKSISTFAPVSRVEKVSLSETETLTSAEVTVKAFWSELPTKLPSLTEPISQLSAQETEILSQISGLKRPSFIEVEPSEPIFRPNPFE